MKPFDSSWFRARITLLRSSSQSSANTATDGHTTDLSWLAYSHNSTTTRYWVAVTPARRRLRRNARGLKAVPLSLSVSIAVFNGAGQHVTVAAGAAAGR
jgi:hypothetical protein